LLISPKYMPEPIISIKNISKNYIISHRASYGTLRDSLTNLITKPFYRHNKFNQECFSALKDISFNVQPKECIGIIGINGAGKSTLLKILSQITPPTSGWVTLRGRVASLLEVGTGFHPELTGRENIFLNGAILGMKQSEIKEKFDEIVAFAEIEKFLDTPVKRYSSGMYVRLAFAVAANLEPEILIVDEVLAVGDAEFQKKCLGKMEDIASHGRTIIFVSHNMSAISSFCNRSIVLDHGKIKFIGPTTKAIEQYLSHSAGTSYEAKQIVSETKPKIIKSWITDENDRSLMQLYNGNPFVVNILIENPKEESVEIALSVFDRMRRPLWNFTHQMHNLPPLNKKGRIHCKLLFSPPFLTVSGLTFDLALGPRGGLPYFDHIINALDITLIDKQESQALVRYPDWPILCDTTLTLTDL